MIDAAALLSDLKQRLPNLEDDLRARTEASDEAGRALDAELRGQYAAEREASRTADAYEVWRDAWVTQVAVAWLLSLVFVRYLEDNALVPPRIAGSRDRWQRADDFRQLYIQAHPTHSDARFLQHVVFDLVGAVPAAAGLFGQHNLARAVAPSGDMATTLLDFFKKQGDDGALVHDFGGMRRDTRFLGDLYQDLSEAARSRYALLQTPDFVEEFILDHTMEPALETFGLEGFRILDPTCGSGHFLLGAFGRLLDRWQAREPNTPVADLARRAMDSVWGVDINPFAVAIARFRLLLAALDACGVERLDAAPAFEPRVTVADSLLAPMELGIERGMVGEDVAATRATYGAPFHAVVGNPPYITVKDKNLNKLYRGHYDACHMKYALAAPFTEMFFNVARRGGYVGLIVANSFMKREFGKPLIERVLPRHDLTHVIDTSGAYIPGHGTPTVILFGRKQPRQADTLRAVLGIRGEPTTPSVPSDGAVWSSIRDHAGDGESFENDFITVADVDGARFDSHPWSLQGGGAGPLKAQIESHSIATLGMRAAHVGPVAICGEDEVYVFEGRVAPGLRRHVVPLALGNFIRDWTGAGYPPVIHPFTALGGRPLEPLPSELLRWFWRYRDVLRRRAAFGVLHEDRGKAWFEYRDYYRDKLATPLSIAFAEVSTHNHFVLDRGGKVFKQTAPVIKLPAEASEADHLALLGLLNSSAACFWLKQVCHCKGFGGVNEGLRWENWDPFYQFAGTKLRDFPLVDVPGSVRRLATRLDAAARAYAEASERAGLTAVGEAGYATEAVRDAALHAMVAMQEELDWHVYRAYGLLDGVPEADRLTTDGIPPPVRFGERAFEILMARKIVAGELQTAWFERHRGTPITEVPSHWPADYRATVEARLRAIARNKTLRLLEQPEHKRRWSTEPFADLVARNTRGWLLDRLETPAYIPHADRETPTFDPPTMMSTAHLAERAAADEAFLAVARVYAGRDDFDLTALVTDLVKSEAVPALPALRFKAAGLRKRAIWERVWDLQRREDAAEQVDIPVPPKYGSGDFRDTVSWRMRGKLDVPKERFNLYPYAATAEDAGVYVTWAGLDHLQRAQAVAAAYLDRKDHRGWPTDALVPFLAELDQLVPWLKQWHNDVDPEFGQRMGDYYAEFVQSQAHELGQALDDLRAWAPPKRTRGRRKKKV